MDDALCPVVGTATTVLPPDHPDMLKAKEGDVCPVTKATVGHHKDKVVTHPSVMNILRNVWLVKFTSWSLLFREPTASGS